MPKKRWKLKKIDAITAVLSFFILIIIVLSLYIINVNKHIEEFSAYDDAVHQLKSINKDFDNLLLKKGKFINYDIINQRVVEFDKEIKFLNTYNPHTTSALKYEVLLKDVKKEYDLKLNEMESFKSLNAQFLYSIHYLYAINTSISESHTLEKNTIYLSNKILLSIVKYFMYIDIDTQSILANISALNTVNDKEHPLIKIYLEHVDINLKRIKTFNNISQFQVLQKMKTALDNLHIFLNNSYQKNIFIEKVFIIILSSMGLMILILLFIMNRRASKLKDELLGFRTAIENSYNSIIMTDLEKNIVYVNERAQLESGYSREELIGNNPRILKSGMNDKNFYTGLHTALAAGEKWEGEFVNKKKDGSLLYEKSSIMPIFQDGEVVNYLAIKLNITDYIDEKHKVEYMAYHDALTGLPNRLSAEEYLKKRLPLAQRNNLKIAILFIDLDRFKMINDTLGHDVGDELLVACAKRIKSSLRDSDILARVGGDEFIIITEELNNAYSAAHVSEKIIQLFKSPIQTKAHLLNITLSIGISIYPDDDTGVDCQQLLKYADIAMYEAKSEGRNTYRYYKKELSIDAHKRLQLEQNLKTSLNNNELFMMYQPQYNIANKTVIGMEALIRWDSPKLGQVSPDIFIPIAEDTGFIIDIGLYIFEQACKDFLEFQKHITTLQNISINISAVQLYQESFIDKILKITTDIGLDPKYIILEITETHIMKNIVQSKKLLNNLKTYGFDISIDDFGTGHSSLKYLQEFPISELKIDKTFIDYLPHDKNNVAITKSILALSEAMGYVNVAEGIENREQELFLEENHCLRGQGYYFSKPLAKDNFIQFIQTNK